MEINEVTINNAEIVELMLANSNTGGYTSTETLVEDSAAINIQTDATRVMVDCCVEDKVSFIYRLFIIFFIQIILIFLLIIFTTPVFDFIGNANTTT